MKKIVCMTVFLGMSLFASLSQAQQETYPFNSPKQTVQFQHLLTSLRCLVCQNQDLANSNAPLAQDLKKDVYSWVQAGQSDDQIIQALTNRYGDFILFNPPIKPVTYILWGAPMILLLLGLVLFWRQVNRDK
jgi:cytochrome c-type biogenesis protein CcmH